ncbi:MAG: tyrosine-type recombinase/integrase [Deltaproteobacteria bacterium]|jgi:integrase|nr:tyrosine-type recombinase/integrase [Deltaproteobacteria bacterium]
MPNGKQRREPAGYLVSKARDADGKRRAQKRENRLFDILPESRITFGELTDWYMNSASVKKLSSYSRVNQALKNFNSVFFNWRLDSIKQTDLEEYQILRKDHGRADATIDMEIKYAQAVVTKAFDNDKIDGRCLKSFRKTNRLLEKGSNVRKTIISIKQYLKLLQHAPAHYSAVLIIAFNTGMRLGEIKLLRWSYIDRDSEMIRLPKNVTKESRAKDIPINQNINSLLATIPRTLPQNDFIITYRGLPMCGKSSLKKQFSETCQKADIPYGRKMLNGITFHDIRRSVKTFMLHAGVDKIHRDTILGHSLKGMDAHYIVITDESLTKAMNKYTNWLDQQINSQIVDQNVDQSRIKNEIFDR